MLPPLQGMQQHTIIAFQICYTGTLGNLYSFLPSKYMALDNAFGGCGSLTLCWFACSEGWQPAVNISTLPDISAHFYVWCWDEPARPHRQKTYRTAPSRQHSLLPGSASLCPLQSFHAISDLVLLAVPCHHHPLLHGMQHSPSAPGCKNFAFVGCNTTLKLFQVCWLQAHTHTRATIMSYGHKAKCHSLWAWPACSRAKLALGGVGMRCSVLPVPGGWESVPRVDVISDIDITFSY